jgi:hypothetical protein
MYENNNKISIVSFLRKFEHRLKGLVGWGGSKREQESPTGSSVANS